MAIKAAETRGLYSAYYVFIISRAAAGAVCRYPYQSSTELCTSHRTHMPHSSDICALLYETLIYPLQCVKLFLSPNETHWFQPVVI